MRRRLPSCGFSDESSAKADAIIWCTGFSDKDARDSAVQILSGDAASTGEEGLLGPHAFAALLDATWGVDGEGEIRCMWAIFASTISRSWMVSPPNTGGTRGHWRSRLR